MNLMVIVRPRAGLSCQMSICARTKDLAECYTEPVLSLLLQTQICTFIKRKRFSRNGDPVVFLPALPKVAAVEDAE